ncbi:MAG: 2-oxoacid:acceptor oxidoreductase family protein [Clostridia bacterium]
MDEKIIIAGFGGQGVLSLGLFIAQAAIAAGKETTWLPSYGPEMRGGTSNCSVVVSDSRVASPLIPFPDYLIAMNKPSLYKFVDKVRPNGVVIVNSSLIPDKVERTDITTIYVDAGVLAAEAGNAKTANIVVLGAFLKQSGLFSLDLAAQVIKEKFSKKPYVIEANLKALELGYNL